MNIMKKKDLFPPGSFIITASVGENQHSSFSSKTPRPGKEGRDSLSKLIGPTVSYVALFNTCQYNNRCLC